MAPQRPQARPLLRTSRRTTLAGLLALAGHGAALGQMPFGTLMGALKPKKDDDKGEDSKKPELVPGKRGIFTAGYSEKFIPVRDMLSRADFSNALAAFVVAPGAPPAPATQMIKTDAGKVDASKPATGKAAAKGANAGAGNGAPKEGSKDPGKGSGKDAPKALTSDAFLANAEIGLIDFEAGNYDEAIDRLRKAEDIHQHGKSVGATLGRGLGFLGGVVTGQGEMGPYQPHDHEAVLQLNYLALAHLFKGQPTCYNVARRCIDYQQELKAKFDKQIEEAGAKLKAQEAADAKRAEEAAKAGKSAKTVDGKAGAPKAGLDDFAGEFKAYDAYARRVPNAYVNPLGDYLSGLIQEIASREQEALRDNAVLAYQSAIRLCGHSPQLQAAVVAMKRPRSPASERVVHVIVGEGFAPERRELFYVVPLVDQIVPLHVPIFAPVSSPVERIEVQAGAGKPMALDPIGDFEAIRLRAQQDRVPLILFEVVTKGAASYIEGKATHKLGFVGDLLHGAKEAAAHADTRCWLSLPRRFHVARVVLPAAATSVTLTSVGRDGRRLASQQISVPKGESHTIVYARAVDNQLVVQNARRLWIDGKLETENHA